MRLAAVVFAAALASAACSSTEEPVIVDQSFLEITDCGELERLASVEVDRINGTGDRDVVAAATARFEAIVAHRDSIC